MATLQELERGLVMADQAGNADDARAFAAEIRRMRATKPAAPVERNRIKETALGVVRGAADIGDTLINAATYLPRKISPGLEQWNQERQDSLASVDAENADSNFYAGGRLASNVAGTVGVGGVIAAPLRAASTAAPRLAPLAESIATGGFRTGAAPGLLNAGTRAVGGAVTGGAATALVSPENAGTGAVLGAALPGALNVAGRVGSGIGRTISGPQVPQATREAVEAARTAGYVIPPTQARPTLANRALEGFSGKITTAQNASARNQPVTNELARKAIGANELSPEGLAQVRAQANSAYDQLGQVGAFQADQAFVSALDKAGATSNALRQNFPELANGEVDTLIEGLKGRGSFDAQPTIEAIKRFRSNASANKISTDPAKKALGQAQSKIAAALEDLIDRNLQATGQQDLLATYRTARQTLAKVYDVEKALNPASGNIDANKLAALLKKGRPLTGELEQIAQFGSQFPKAAQTVERMGSLPQVSPLDFGALGTMSALTSNPLLMAGVLARPAARSAVLSPMVQNRLAQPTGQNALAGLLRNAELQLLPYRGGPVLATDR